jgi:hypothetical protein
MPSFDVFLLELQKFPCILKSVFLSVGFAAECIVDQNSPAFFLLSAVLPHQTFVISQFRY